MLLLLCASYANASKIEPDCAQERADRAEVLDLAGEALDALSMPADAMADAMADKAADNTAEHVPSSPEFEAVMSRILEVSVLDGVDDDGRRADDADVSPVAEADVDGNAAERSESDAGWASDSAQLPGLSEAATERYRRHMYRTDI